MSNIHKGQCLCGAVKFETPAPAHIDACHCKACQSWTGSLFIGADFRNGITITQDKGLFGTPVQSGPNADFAKPVGLVFFTALKTMISSGRWPPDVSIYPKTLC